MKTRFGRWGFAGSYRIAASALLALVAAGGVASGDGGGPAGSTIVVNVGTFRNRSGSLGCRLYRSAGGFPESSDGTVEKRLAIGGDVTQCSFENVAPGTYAISVMHDENDNRKLDKNFFGVPTEGYGVSNNHTRALSAPTWEESRFTVEKGKNIGLAIGLRY
jgi:uncharacterized protein (DUF2141 family)